MQHRTRSLGLRVALLAGVALCIEVDLLHGQQAEGEIPPIRRFQVTRAGSEIEIDGVMDEPAWSDAVSIDLPWEWFPGDNTPAPVATDCRVAFDDTRLYIGCRALDQDPAQVRAHLADRDDLDRLLQDDHLGFLLDTFNDQRRAFQFRVNPLGVQADAILSTSEGFEDFSWDAIWDSKGNITADGYVVEIGIPFRSLRFPAGEQAQTWGFQAFRSYPRSVRHRIASSWTDRNNTCLLCQTNKLDGLEGIAPGHNLEFDPTFTSSRTDTIAGFPDGDMDDGDIEPELGLTAFWGVTPGLMLAGALNPDFSQVEADVAQLEVNARFALFYPEKRPFFLEGADYFLTPIDAVFTRTVVEPLAGLKLTGKEGKNAVGVFATQDTLNNLIMATNQASVPISLDQDVTGGVVRYRRDVGGSSTVGVLYTGRLADDYYNHAAGVDAFWQISSANSMRLQYLYTFSDLPDEVAETWGQATEAFEGDGIAVEFQHVSRNWGAWAEYLDLDPDVRADFGFIRRVDLREIDVGVQRVVWGSSDGWFSRLDLGVGYERTEDHDGLLTDQSVSAFAGYSGPLQTELGLMVSADKEYFDGVTYDLVRGHGHIEIRPSGKLALTLFAALGDAIDYANSREADELQIGPGLSLAVGRHFRMDLDHSLQRLSFEGDKIVTEYLTQARLLYHLNVRSFVRLILQYRDVSRDPDMYELPVEPETEGLFSELLFTYKVNPKTVLYLGYSDTRLGNNDASLTQTGRTFFLKIGYALRV
ncbi:MAG: carbohydrate binding family 9 domain-containing protein [Gemmatimonadota bacterium]|nr:MAG: carbohydrate binding family 9 domain-containing protein [Gemmatimonadota bacterium]